MSDESSVSTLLAEHSFTRELSDEDRQSLAAIAMVQRFGAGELIIQEGRPADAFFLLVDGEVAIEVFAPGAPTRTLQTVEPNSAIGWSWLVPPYQWEFDARAATETLALRFAAHELRVLFQHRCNLGLHIVGKLLIVVANRLKGTRLQLLDLYAPPGALRP